MSTSTSPNQDQTWSLGRSGVISPSDNFYHTSLHISLCMFFVDFIDFIDSDRSTLETHHASPISLREISLNKTLSESSNELKNSLTVAPKNLMEVRICSYMICMYMNYGDTIY